MLIVGAGISGLSAALEAGRGGARVVVVDMFSVFGGHAVMSTGGVLLVGTPEQEARGIKDSPELAFNDFMRYGEDAQAEWVRRYVQGSRREVYDWLTGLGVRFSEIEPVPGNSVPRFHNTEGRGLGLVSPIYRESVGQPNLRFEWNTQITGLMVERGRVVGATGKDVRTGRKRQFRARAVILATGGFQSNLELVREYWPKNLPFPERMLVGAGVNAVGSGLALARRAGGVLRQTDHQWNYPYGLPDPRYPGSNRGLNASNLAAIWVNADGKRFVNELASVKEVLPALLHQEAATYWMIFDAEAKPLFWVSGTDWADFRRIEELILGNPDLTKTADTLEDLAAVTGLPAAALAETIHRYNEMVTRGLDTAFGRFGPGLPADPGIPPAPPRRIVRPPFYALQFFPLTRKSMGGVVVNLSCRVLDKQGQPIPGLFAVGELTGVGGINGKAALEGTFLGPGVLMGRMAAQAVLAELKLKSEPVGTSDAQPEAPPAGAGPEESSACLACHDLPSLIGKSRRGYWHFEKVHGVVLKRQSECTQCHAELAPYREGAHRINPLAQIANCAACHLDF